MKIRCITACTGLGYEDFNVGEEKEINEELGNKLIKFCYVEKVKEMKGKKNLKVTENKNTWEGKGNGKETKPKEDGNKE